MSYFNTLSPTVHITPTPLQPHHPQMDSDIRYIHTLLGSILSFLVVFRSNAAYDRYYEGQPPPSLH